MQSPAVIALQHDWWDNLNNHISPISYHKSSIRRLMQARDREPLRCIQNCAPSHASSMPELPPPPRPPSGASASASTSTSTGVVATAIPGIVLESATSPTTLVVSQTDPPTPTSRRVRFQGDLDAIDHAAGSSRVTLSPNNDRNSSSSPSPPPASLPRTNVSRSRSLQPEEVASTSAWGA